MRIKVKPPRLLSDLESDRFVNGPTLLGQDSFTFVRETSNPDLFEWIIVEASGKKSEAVYASVAIALTRTVLIMDISISEESPLLEIADVPERGWSIIESTAAARAWEAKLVAVAPQSLTLLSEERSVDLLQRTGSLRRAVKRYVANLDLTRSLSDMIENPKRDADPKLLGIARRLAWGIADRLAPEVAERLAWVDVEDIYGLAWLCVASYEANVEEQATTFAHVNPNDHPDLLWRIHLIADWVMFHYNST